MHVRQSVDLFTAWAGACQFEAGQARTVALMF